MIKSPTFLSVAQTARLGFITEYRLRAMIKAGTCPGFRSGNKYQINVDQLIKLLEGGELNAEKRNTGD